MILQGTHWSWRKCSFKLAPMCLPPILLSLQCGRADNTYEAADEAQSVRLVPHQVIHLCTGTDGCSAEMMEGMVSAWMRGNTCKV